MKKLICLLVMILTLLLCAPAYATDLYVEDVTANYAFTLDGIELQLPTPLSTLLENGWSLDEYAADVALPAMSYDSATLYKDNVSVPITVVNATDAELDLPECALAGILLFAADDIPFELSNGISFASSLDEVLLAYGLDKAALLDEYAEGSVGFSLSFYAQEDDGLHEDKGIESTAVGMNQIDLNFDKPLSEGGMLESIQLRYMDGAE